MTRTSWACLLLLPVLWVGGSTALECQCSTEYCSTPTCSTDGICFLSLKRGANNGEVVRSTRCIDKNFLIPIERPFVCEYNLRLNHTYISACCKDKDYCNADLQLRLAPYKGEGTTSKPGGSTGGSNGRFESHEASFPSLSLPQVVAVLAAFLLVVSLSFVALLSVFCRKRASFFRSPSNCCGRSGRSTTSGNRSYHEVESCETNSSLVASSNRTQTTLVNSNTTVGSASLHELCSTGSGSGLPILVQRSVARQIALQSIIGKGRFGEVWQGNWRGEKVAVKIFSTYEEKSWFREVEIYQTVMLRHANILGFIAADNKDNGSWTQLWLVTEYMEHGSLYDFLRRRTVDALTMLRMCLGIATGLAHLHMEIVGTHGKPAIAHRDLKSKNILVKRDGVCAIGDLGLAVRYTAESNVIDLPQSGRVGTKRYLAPELLDETLNPEDFDAFKRADIYAFGLILWEIASRSYSGSEHVGEHELPYAKEVGFDPDIEEMRKVVCVDGCRPEKFERWRESKLYSGVYKVMSECWYESPSSRLTPLRVKKSIAGLIDRHFHVSV